MEEEQIQRLRWMQEQLAAAGVRTLLVRRLRLTLAQNRYHPPEADTPVLAVGRRVTIAVDGDYLVGLAGAEPVRFADADETIAYVSALITSAR
ncbi:MAG: hypothetical protein HOY71_42535 [Nonomuraea sp.]|nr:hypothetical protein [Nonomuraea sp.]